jgi:hypothetical protein
VARYEGDPPPPAKGAVWLAILGISWFLPLAQCWSANSPARVGNAGRAARGCHPVSRRASVAIAIGSLIVNRLLTGEVSACCAARRSSSRSA